VTVDGYVRDGSAIYARSFAIIRQEADLRRFPPDLEPAVVRMIHACGMVDLAADVDFSPGVGTAIREALGAGAPVFTDSMMLADGITRARLPAGNDVCCTLRADSVVARAAAMGTRPPRCSGCSSCSRRNPRGRPRSSACQSGSSAPRSRSSR
jgi:precorrin-8X/cobalt-precorrin-8 methylmutase